MKKATVLLVDDHRAIIEGVKSSLTSHPDLEVIGECADGQTALDLVKTKKPDLVILDISIPNVDGVEVARQIQKLGLKARVVIYTMHSDSQFVIDLFKYGISAYVLKEDPLADLIRALEAVRAGGTYFSQIAPTVLAKRLEDLECWKENNHGISSLSDREREVFLLLAQGETIKKIAFQLNISPKTVESHKYNIMDKLQVESIVDMTKLAIRKKLIIP